MDGLFGNGPGKRSRTRKRTATLTVATWNVRTMMKLMHPRKRLKNSLIIKSTCFEDHVCWKVVGEAVE
ncbi:hypothetical protein L798_05431 [Zootermopsis nevadensis]|uniref:Uncharacterized protein n=1 Tax=Zootermopsis nevadensis TaxID=136037 RepID=A0A067QHD6_ZOONE|nr:hypothetical protein L798_05431 [Zootermopsis nevadensis]